MQLIVEPEGGIMPILDAIDNAKDTIEILIFRLDCKSVTKGLKAAVRRGVAVRAMIAKKHRGDTRDLRRLERRLLKGGVVLARTGGDLVRYHGKMMIVDRRVLHVYGFNYTRADYASRSFGIVTTNRRLVREALKLFESDASRRPYRSGTPNFVVSPDNSRERLATFIRGARRQLLIYDPRLSDEADAPVAAEARGRRRRRAGHRRGAQPALATPGRAVSRLAAPCAGHHPGRQQAFVGSQSLQTLALEGRREIGVIVSDTAIVTEVAVHFRT